MRVLIAGLATSLGGRLAQALEREPGVGALVGVDTRDPRHELDRTDFVRVGADPDLLRRIIHAAAIDTVIDTRLLDDPLTPVAQARATNIEGTRALLDACAAPDSTVRKLVVKSSAEIYPTDSDGPAFLTEDADVGRPSGPLAATVAVAQTAVRDLAALRPGLIVTVLRVASVLCGEDRSTQLTVLGWPAVPGVLGFDPRMQYVHADDVVGALGHVARHDLRGTFNVAADGVLALSEVAGLLGKPLLPVLPPWGGSLVLGALRRVGLRLPLEYLDGLRAGRGLDNRRLKAAGFRYRYTAREAVVALRARQRLRPLLASGNPGYRYDREVEEFLRRSRNVTTAEAPTEIAEPAASAYDVLSATEIVEAIPSLPAEDLDRLRDHERAHRARPRVLDALERRLAQTQGEHAADP